MGGRGGGRLIEREKERETRERERERESCEEKPNVQQGESESKSSKEGGLGSQWVPATHSVLAK